MDWKDHALVKSQNGKVFVAPEDWGELPEYDLIEWCRQYMKADKTFISVGDHCGHYSISLANLCRNVMAFEPQRHTHRLLRANIVLNDLEQCVRAYNYAVAGPGTHLCKQDLQIISKDGGGSTLRHDLVKRDGTTVHRSEEVVCIELDKWLGADEHVHIGFMKVDAEGMELSIFQGAELILRRDQPVLLFESWARFESDRKALFDFLVSLNYTIYPIRGYPEMFLARVVMVAK